MKEKTGASDSAKIEVLRGRGNTGNVSMGGVFGIEAFHADGTCFHSSEHHNTVTLEWVKELTHIYASSLDGSAEMDEGTTTVIGSLAGGSIIYDPAGDGDNKYAYRLEVGTNDGAAVVGDTYANSGAKRASSAAFIDATRQVWGTAAIPLIFAGEADGATATTTKYTATNQRVHSVAVDERAEWEATGAVTIESVALVFTNDTVMADVDGRGGTIGLNKLVARALTGEIILADDDTLKVRYSMTLLAS